jgi:hypothetical protein
MKVLLDECVPRKFKNWLPGHDCRTVPEEGLAGRKNGELLAEKAGFQVFVSLDRGLEHEQNLQRRIIAIILVRVKSNRLADLLPHRTEILQVLGFIKPGELVKVG